MLALNLSHTPQSIWKTAFPIFWEFSEPIRLCVTNTVSAPQSIKVFEISIIFSMMLLRFQCSLWHKSQSKLLLQYWCNLNQVTQLRRLVNLNRKQIVIWRSVTRTSFLLAQFQYWMQSVFLRHENNSNVFIHFHQSLGSYPQMEIKPFVMEILSQKLILSGDQGPF